MHAFSVLLLIIALSGACLASLLRLDSESQFQAGLVSELQAGLGVWTRALRECDGDDDCYRKADDALRPIVQRAVQTRELPQLKPCEKGWGTFNVPTEGREWNIESNLPC